MISRRRIFLLVSLLILGFYTFQQGLSKQQVEVSKEAATTGKIIAGEVATVRYVIDGDTIDLTDGRRVRYIGIDATETAHEGKSAECFASAAKEENKRLVEGKTIRLEKDISETDKYGRLLRYIFVGDQLVNESLVYNGFARAWDVPPDEVKKNQLFAAQESAKVGKRGLWTACP